MIIREFKTTKLQQMKRTFKTFTNSIAAYDRPVVCTGGDKKRKGKI
jgi:hypothetical protein